MRTKAKEHCDLAFSQWRREGSLCACTSVFVSVGGRRRGGGASHSPHKQQQVHIMLGRKLLESQTDHVAPLEPAAALAAKQINQQGGTWQPERGGREIDQVEIFFI